MAMNPMQRKANSYLLIGVLVTLLITGAIIVLLFMQLNKLQEEKKEQEKNSVKVWVLSQDVKSGQIITTDMLTQQITVKTLVPSNAIGDMSIISNYALADKEGNEVVTEYKNNVATLYLYKNGMKYELKQEDTGNYYIELSGDKQYVELTEEPIVAKVDMNKNTVLTLEMLNKSNEKTTDDLRKQEYNMVILPTQIKSGDYIDIRLRLSDGTDYIVVSKKCVEIPEINGVESANTILINMSEAETMIMSNAIIEAYVDKGSLFYATTYVEPGIQETVIPTYVPAAEVQQALNANPNIEQEAKNELFARYTANNNYVRQNLIAPNINKYVQDRVDSIEAGVQEQITKAKQERQSYLESLGGY